ncbi:ATP-grasp domain-containing protein [Microlunatus soli]|uniref:Biotin carboxylase n=1 Tax=Microlunatus soli TaxID=630515 RepID=A0A1H1VV29_9ACTN|nr:ATP-grasp domain-containing protein [Microlunatus soli]SDS88613.1 Biotin carboxylase [Microlunatus soli]
MPHELAVFIESNTTGNGARMLDAAVELGHRPVLIAADPGRYRFVPSTVQRVRADTSDPAALADLIRGLADDIALVCSSSDHFQATAARVAATLDLRGPDPDAIACCQDKARQRAVLADAGVAVPAHLVVDNSAAARTAAQRIGGPVVVKPIVGTGSVGVRLCHDPAAAAEHAAVLLADRTDERGNVRPAQVLVEQFISGREFSVEVLQGAVLGVTETHLGAPPSFVEIGHDHPATITAEERAAVVGATAAAVSSLGLDRQTAHVEIRLDVSRPFIIEVNPRLPGGHITDLVRLGTGVDMITEYLRSMAGAGPRLHPNRHRAAAIRHLTSSMLSLRPAGVSGHGSSSDDCFVLASGYPGVVQIGQDAASGDGSRTEFGDFRDRVAHVITVGADTATAAARAEAAALAVQGCSAGGG